MLNTPKFGIKTFEFKVQKSENTERVETTNELDKAITSIKPIRKKRRMRPKVDPEVISAFNEIMS